MFKHINVNSCKTVGCKNIGVLESPDYQPLGENVLCRECGFLFPLIAETALNAFRGAVNYPWKGLLRQCPDCGGTSLKRHGYAVGGKARLLCRHCNRTFLYTATHGETKVQGVLSEAITAGVTLAELRRTLKIDNTALARQLARLSLHSNREMSYLRFPTLDIALSTCAFTLNFNDSENTLYTLVTAEVGSGNIVAVSTNYSPLPVDHDYQYSSRFAERPIPGALVHLVQRKEKMTARRGLLFDIDYGTATLWKNDSGMLVKPVLPAYRHFELVKRLTDERSLNVLHFIEHECFIFGGCLMANYSDVNRGRCHISFVTERGVQRSGQNRPPRYFLAGGIRNNAWRYYSTREYAMAVSNLTGNKKMSQVSQATLLPATRFIQYIESHPFSSQMKRLSPANVGKVLDYFRYEYNQKLIS